jgi:hypothetical protein
MRTPLSILNATWEKKTESEKYRYGGYSNSWTILFPAKVARILLI